MNSRISPIEKPKGIFKKVMYYLMKKEFGKVIMPAKVIYSRYPKIGLLVKKLYSVEHSLKLIKESDKFLIKNFVATKTVVLFVWIFQKKNLLTKVLD